MTMSTFLEKKQTIQSIVRVFETGKATPSYGTTTILPDGAGLSFGEMQSTDASDSLDRIIFSYRDAHGLYADEFIPYIQYLATDATAKVDPKHPPQWCVELIALLKKAGTDPIMGRCQDFIFDTNYWEPAVKQAEQMKLTLPLTYGLIFDTVIQSGSGGVAKIRKLFPEVPPSSGGDEKKWAQAYVKARKNWLLSFTNPIVQRTIYRMNEFQTLIDAGNWNLDLPLKIRNVNIG